MRYSYAGRQAATADTDKLRQAKKMELQGKSNEEIRQETGWFRGMDDEWRFEVDDSSATVHENGDAIFSEKQGVKRRQELLEKELLGSISEDEQKELDLLDETYGGEVWRLSDLVRDGDAYLPMVLKHDAIYQAYPELSKVRIQITDDLGGSDGSYDGKSKKIRVLSYLPDFEKKAAILHELQHAIQDIEGFTRGSSPEIFRKNGYAESRLMDLYMNTAGEIEARDTATRRNLDAEGRKKTPPDLGDEKTVFAERPSVSWMKERKQNGEQSGIKAQLRAAQGTLADMQPVATVDAPKDTGETMGDVRKWAIDLLKGTGYTVDRAGFGKIVFDEKRLNTSLNYIETKAEIVAYAALPRVLKRGVEISSHGNHKGRDYSTVTFAAPIVINGKRGNMAVVVKKTNGNYYKMHRILMPDGSTYVLEDSKNAEPTPERGLTQMSTHANPISSASDTRVPRTVQTVKAESAEDGRKFSRRDSAARSDQRKLTPGKVTFDGDEKNLTRDQRTNMAGLRVVAEALNVPIHVFESKVDPETGKRVGANGWYDPKDGSIHIDLHAGADGAGTMMFTAAHEVVHLIRDRALDEYDFLRGYVFHGLLTPEVAQSLVEKQIAQARQQGRIITKDIATEEVVASSLEAVLTRKDAFKSLQKIQAQNKSLFERIRTYFSNLSAKLSKLYSGLHPDSEEARIVESASVKSKEILYQFRRAVSGAVTVGQKMAEKAQQEDRDNSGRTLSAEQEQYFRDSTVRDYAGRLKRVYHGSGSFFSQFTYDFVGKSGLHEGLGFYFTDSREIADRYSTGPDRRRGTENGTVYEVYLNLHNTLSGDRVTMGYGEFSRFLDAAKRLGEKNGLHVDIDAEDFYTQSTSDVELVNKIMFAGFAKHGAELAEEFLRTLQRTTGYDGTEM